MITLVDESDDPAVKLRQAAITEPDRFATIAGDPRGQPLSVPGPGVLYCASLPGRQYAVLVSAPHADNVRRLQDLSLTVTLNPNKKSRRDFTSYVGVLRLWSGARVVGKLGLLRRDQVIHAVVVRLLSIACGGHWAEVLTRVKRGVHLAGDLDYLQRSIGGSPGFASRIRNARWNLADDNQAGNINQMLDAAALYNVCNDRRVVAAATTFAFTPTALRLKKDDPFAAVLLNHRALLRGAAFAATLETVAASRQLEIA